MKFVCYAHFRHECLRDFVAAFVVIATSSCVAGCQDEPVSGDKDTNTLQATANKTCNYGVLRRLRCGRDFDPWLRQTMKYVCCAHLRHECLRDFTATFVVIATDRSTRFFLFAPMLSSSRLKRKSKFTQNLTPKIETRPCGLLCCGASRALVILGSDRRRKVWPRTLVGTKSLRDFKAVVVVTANGRPACLDPKITSTTVQKEMRAAPNASACPHI